MTDVTPAKTKAAFPRARKAVAIVAAAAIAATAGSALGAFDRSASDATSQVAADRCAIVGEAVTEAWTVTDVAAERGLSATQRAWGNRWREVTLIALARCLEQTPTTSTTSPAPTTTSTTAPPATTTTAPATTTTAPPSGGFPDASNTGPSGQLSPSGPISTSSNGQIIQNVAINGDVFVNHSNVTLRNFTLINGRIYINASETGATGLTIEDCHLDGNGYDGAAVSEHEYTIRRCEVIGYADGLRVNGNVVIEDNYVHDFPDFISQGAHQDAVQITSGSNVVIRHNTLHIGVDGCNAVVMIGSFTGSNILVERNLLTGSCGFVGYGGDNQYTGVRYLDNRISTLYHPNGGFHGVFAQASQATIAGNVWHDGPGAGQLIGENNT